MGRNNHTDVTDKNLDRLADFLTSEMAAPSVSEQIPDGAHLFHGAHNDLSLTNANLDLASEVLLGMILGYVDQAPLVMVFERAPGQNAVIDLSDETSKQRAEAFIELFRRTPSEAPWIASARCCLRRNASAARRGKDTEDTEA